MDNELYKKVEENAVKIDAIYKSVEKTRKYFLWTLVATLVMFVLPLIGLAFAIPAFLATFSSLGL